MIRFGTNPRSTNLVNQIMVKNVEVVYMVKKVEVVLSRFSEYAGKERKRRMFFFFFCHPFLLTAVTFPN